MRCNMTRVAVTQHENIDTARAWWNSAGSQTNQQTRKRIWNLSRYWRSIVHRGLPNRWRLCCLIAVAVPSGIKELRLVEYAVLPMTRRSYTVAATAIFFFRIVELTLSLLQGKVLRRFGGWRWRFVD